MSEDQHIPKSIKLLTLARGIRWFGWGMCETLIPVLLFSFSRNYVDAGILRSIYDIVFLVSLPVVSILADRIPAKLLILLALGLYPLIGISYFIAGTLGTALFIVVARSINGVTWCLDSVGGDTYLRRFALDTQLSKTFGYLSSLPNFSWIIAALISIPLLPFVPIRWLFLTIVPTAFIAYFVLSKAPLDEVPIQEKSSKYFQNLMTSIKGIPSWKPEVWGLAFLVFLVACIDLLGTFFIPLFTYTESNNLVHVVLITVVFAIPSAFAFWMGSFIDKVSKRIFIAISFLIAALLLILLSLTHQYTFQLIGIFILGILTVAITLALQSFATTISTKDHYGRIGGVMAGADELGAVIGPIAIGALIDHSGMSITFLVLGVVAIVTAGISNVWI